MVPGCADMNWNLANYQGVKFNGEHCTIKPHADTARCADLPNRNEYERERDALKPAAGMAAEN